MLLRYLSHHTTFSSKRPFVPQDALSHIGLYWRVDTQFANIMNGRGIEKEKWISAFNHLISLLIGVKIINSLVDIADSNFNDLTLDKINKYIEFDLTAYDRSFIGNISDLLKALNQKFTEFEMWVANVNKVDEPLFIPGVSFLKNIISQVKDSMPTFSRAIYFVYIDEYENLLKYQQRIINTFLKHSEEPLIFNIAMKNMGFSTRETLGNESIVDISDYRTHNIEELLSDDFNYFAAEIAFLNLSIAGYDCLPIDIEVLRDPGNIFKRVEASYREKVNENIKVIFPGLTHNELALTVFKDQSLKRILKNNISAALKLKGSYLEAENFIREELPKASIVSMSLLFRKSLSPNEILSELDLLANNAINRFTGSAQWIHNNFIGSLLLIYKSHKKICPFYAGFEAFCKLSKGNLRHFLELCHKSLSQTTEANEVLSTLTVSPKMQAQAAKQAANAFLGEVRSFGVLGNQLHAFVLRLGAIFSLAHSNKAQSEPEQNHFSITHDTLEDNHIQDFLKEAVKWSVLFEEKETKIKNTLQPSLLEYILNPIYSPYFEISYRKQRKISFTLTDFTTIVSGSYADFQTVLKKFSKTYDVDVDETNSPLFAYAFEDHIT